MISDKMPPLTFWITIALLFTASAAVTIVWSKSMSAMEDMPMPGGWGMSMAWMLMPEQSWFEATVSFVAMWDLMMIAMMTPSLAPMLLRYRQAVANTTTPKRINWLTAIVGVGYFLTWTIVGLIIFPLGVWLNVILMQHRALSVIVPVAIGIVLLAAGLLQFTNWKSRQLACCREVPFCGQPPISNAAAWIHGLRLGVQCTRCTAGLMSVLLVTGVMNLFGMAIITAAITLERLAPASKWVTGTIGAIGIGTGFFLIARAVGMV